MHIHIHIYVYICQTTACQPWAQDTKRTQAPHMQPQRVSLPFWTAASQRPSPWLHLSAPQHKLRLELVELVLGVYTDTVDSILIFFLEWHSGVWVCFCCCGNDTNTHEYSWFHLSTSQHPWIFQVRGLVTLNWLFSTISHRVVITLTSSRDLERVARETWLAYGHLGKYLFQVIF